MSRLTSLSIRRPVLASVLSIVIVIFGALSYGALGVREYPMVEPPVISVTTSYSGASAEVVEREITEPLEDQINAVSGIRTLSSVSQEGRSEIRVEFDIGVDLEVAANDVRDRVSRAVENLPEDANPPSVRKEDPNSEPIILFNVASDVRDVLELTQIARSTFREQLRTIEGVSIVSVWGQQRPTIRLWMDPERLAAYDLSPLDVRRAVDIDNAELPSGVLEGATTEFTIRTMGRLESPEEFDELIVAEADGTIVRFRDIGHAELGTRDDRTVLKRDGRPMIGIAVVPQPGANQIDVAREVWARVAQIERNLPDDIEILPVYDRTDFIRASIADVQKTLVLAFVLVVLTIFVFLRDLRTTLIPVLVVPISVVGSFFVMATAGFTINVLTMLALILAISLVVDDAIVILENIFARLEDGLPAEEAGIRGTGEVFFAVVATSLALIAVFTPILFMEGMTGRLFREFGGVMIGAVVISTFVSLTLAPMLTVRFLSTDREPTRFYRRTEPFFRRLNDGYRNALDRFLDRRRRAFGFLAGAAVLSAILLWILPEEVAPLEDRSTLDIRATAPEGATFAYMDGVMDEIAEIVRHEVPELEVLNTITSRRVSNAGEASLTLVDPSERSRGQDEIARALSERLREIPGAEVYATQPQTLSSGGGLPVQFVVQSADPNALREIVQPFLATVRAHPAFSFAEANLRFDKPELRVDIDRDRARSLGVSVRDVAEALRLAFAKPRLGYVTLNGRQEWVQGVVYDEWRSEPRDLLALTVRNGSGALVPLDNLVMLTEAAGPPEVYRFNRLASVTFSAQLADGYTIGDGVAAMRELAARELDESLYTDLAGPSRDFEESASSLNFVFILAIVFVFLVLAAQFESYRDPLIILLTVPLALSGALFALWYFDVTLNVFSKIALIMLVGLVTKNGVLIVEFANQRQLQGLDRVSAVRDAAIARFRPILMTSFSTILGTLPLTLAVGAGAESRSAMGIAVIGGLLVGTVLSLFVVPAIYAMIASEKSQHEVVEEAA